MTTTTIARVLLVALAVIALAFTAPVVSAHGNDTTEQPTTDAPPYDGSTSEWADWMESHMTEHMGPGAVEWMESHMGLSVDEMARHMADGDTRGAHGYGGMYGQGYGGMNGQGHGC